MREETFAPDWLALREPVDHRSRAAGLLPLLDAWWRVRKGGSVLDLGSGTGSNLRYLAPRLTGPQRWTLLDRDRGLLERARTGSVGVSGVVAVDCVHGELGQGGLDAVQGSDLVTASALLDLVTEGWLERLAEACRDAGCAALLALTWDGGVDFGGERAPVGAQAGGGTAGAAGADDAFVLDLVRAHQRRDKGMGPALGPTAGQAAEQAFRRAGLRTWLQPSPWRLGPDEATLARTLIDGWQEAASEQRPEEAARIQAWAERRRGEAERPGFALSVGHVDLLALPAPERGPR